jgi:ribosomal-protein-alanine acetyltransferase
MPETTATIEDASVRHLNRLYEIEKECFGKEAFSKQQIAYLLTDYNSISLVAKVDDEIVGFIIGKINVERKSPVGHILTIDVSPEHRREGIAEKLLQEVEKIFREKAVKMCYLEVREDNIAALSLYRKFGYEKIGRLRNYYGNAHGIYLRKVLT